MTGVGLVESDHAHDLETTRAILRLIPKADLHVHLSGCLRYSTLAELAGRPEIDLHRSARQDLRSAVTLASPSRRYANSFRPWRTVIDKITSLPEYTYRLVWEVAEDMAADGVIYAEARIPARIPFEAAAFRDRMHEINRAARDARLRLGIDLRIIVGFNRQVFAAVEKREQVRMTNRLLRELEPYRHSRVVGFDLYGVERNCPPRLFQRPFHLIAEAGYPSTIHAGEYGKASYIREAIEILGAKRIGHGVLVRDDPSLLELIKSRNVTIETCISSNYFTGVVPDVLTHPLRSMSNSGVRFTLCSDNTLVYGTTLSAEYAIALHNGLLRPDDLSTMGRVAASAAFVPARERRVLEEHLSSVDFLSAAARQY